MGGKKNLEHSFFGTLVKLAFAAVLAAAVMPLFTDLAMAAESGVCGNCVWELDDDGALTIAPIEGTDGVMGSFSNSGEDSLAPWYAYRNEIKSAVVQAGVSAVSTAWMFYDCVYLESVDLSGFVTSNLTDMSYMFYACSSLKSLDVSGFNTSSVENMSSAFCSCSSLRSLDVSGFDTSEVTDMSWMFSGCLALRSLDVSGFDTSEVTDMSGMFSGLKNIQSLDLSSFDTCKVSNMSHMFSGCPSLTALDLSSFDTSKVADMSCMFDSCPNLALLDVSGFDTSRVTNMGNMFSGCLELAPLDVSGFDTSSVTSMSRMFNDCSSLRSLDVSSFDTSRVTDMEDMFNDCSMLVGLDVSGFDTSSVTSMSRMFYGCSLLAELDLSGWDTSRVSSMQDMFRRCKSLESLDLSSWDTSNVTTVSRMFEDCLSLKLLNLSSWDTLEVVDAWGMFYGCSSLCEITLGSWCSLHLYDTCLRTPLAPKAWQAVGLGTVRNPQGAVYSSAEELLKAHVAAGVTETYVIASERSLIPDPGKPATDVWPLFPDVAEEVGRAGGPEKVWYVADGWLDYVVGVGLMSGYAINGCFGPYDNITRAQVACILYRAECAKDPYLVSVYGSTTDPTRYSAKCVFEDMQGGMYYTAAISWAKDAGVMTGDAGTGYTTVRPNGLVSRQELCLMLARYANGGEVPAMALDPTKAQGIKGMNQIASWARDGVYWAVNNGVIGGVDNHDGTYSMNPLGTTWRSAAAKMFTVVMRDVVG